MHGERGAANANVYESCRNNRKYFPSDTRLGLFVFLFGFAPPPFPSNNQPTAPTTSGERQDALVLKASARAVSPALRMECVDNVDESLRVVGERMRRDRAFPS
jgi:hypothetical protein